VLGWRLAWVGDSLVKHVMTRAQASIIHNYAKLTFIEIAKLENTKKESCHSFICCGGARESSRIHDVTLSVTVLATSIGRSIRAE
jgi:hypothetical protein